jgi:hypothetical protein
LHGSRSLLRGVRVGVDVRVTRTPAHTLPAREKAPVQRK